MSNITILLVDDTPSIRDVVRDMLEEIGFSDIHEAASGAEALEVMKTKDISLVVSDFNMAPGSGLDLLGDMKGSPEHCDIPFIMITSESDQQIADRARSLGASAFMKKPLAFPKFRDQVVSVLSRP